MVRQEGKATPAAREKPLPHRRRPLYVWNSHTAYPHRGRRLQPNESERDHRLDRERRPDCRLLQGTGPHRPLVIVLSELKRFYCERHVPACPMKEASGHELWEKQGKGPPPNARTLGCFEEYLALGRGKKCPHRGHHRRLCRAVSEGAVTYPIKDYLRYMSADPWVLSECDEDSGPWSLSTSGRRPRPTGAREILDGAAPLPWTVMNSSPTRSGKRWASNPQIRGGEHGGSWSSSTTWAICGFWTSCAPTQHKRQVGVQHA